MKSKKTQFFAQKSGLINEISRPSIDRRRFIQYAAGAGAMASFGGKIFGQTPDEAATDMRLPDGTAHVSWEQPLTFSKTYYVDNGNSKADDNGPGTTARPFRTINKAAQVLQPGERVVIASGIYREFVRPMRGGSGPDKMISYEAAPGAKVFIRGSEVIKDWTPDPVQQFRGGGPGGPGGGPGAQAGGPGAQAGRPAGVPPAGGQAGAPAGGPGAAPGAQAPPRPAPVPTYGYVFTGATFPDAYNPFALASVAGDRAWLDTKAVDMGPYFRKRGLVFVDGKPLEPVEQQRELTSAKLYTPPPPGTPQPLNGLPTRARGGPLMQEVGGTEDGRFYSDANGQSIHIRLPNGTPAEHMIEITTREQVFAPMERGLGYIRIKGLSFQHAGNGFPLPQRGAMVDIVGGSHWLIEGNTFEWANAIGLEIGGGGGGNAQQPGSAHIVRGNTMRYCGVEGIAGMGTANVMVENNLIEWCGWADAEREWESAGAKFHSARNMMFRNNVIRHIRHSNAVWFDSGNVNNRITGNVFADILTVSAAVHIEVNLGQNQIDNNVIWNVRNSEPGTGGQRGCAGSGIFINASNKVIIAQNLIGKCDNAGVWAITRPDRAGTGTATDNVISNNIFASCGKAGIVFLDPKNQADGNLYVGMPNESQGFFTGDNKQYFTLSAWRDAHGWDKNGAVADMQIDFDPDTLNLTMKSKQPLPKVASVSHIDNDLFGKVTGETRVPGPLADPAAKPVWQVDPRVV